MNKIKELGFKIKKSLRNRLLRFLRVTGWRGILRS
jgi:hypothetical protein